MRIECYNLATLGFVPGHGTHYIIVTIIAIYV